jgi:putative DNA primase/helicase
MDSILDSLLVEDGLPDLPPPPSEPAASAPSPSTEDRVVSTGNKAYQNGAVEGNQYLYIKSDLGAYLALHPNADRDELMKYVNGHIRKMLDPPWSDAEWRKLNAPKLVSRLLAKQEEKNLAQDAVQDWDNGQLIWGARGLAPCLHNAIVFFSQHPDWKDLLRFDRFVNNISTSRGVPFGNKQAVACWTDHHTRLATHWIQYEGLGVGSAVVADAIITVATEQSFNPVIDYFASVKWDGVPRVDGWMVKYLGAPDTAYIRSVGRKFLQAVLARAHQPGCKSDDMVVLEGDQGQGKSRAVEALCPNSDWFSDESFDPRSKDAKIGLRGKLIYEIGELVAVNKSDVDQMKGFLSRKTDKYRAPYGRIEEPFPRTVTFLGTTNREFYLRDETGARRYLPVRTGVIDVAGIIADRDQLWAEAMVIRATGERWWFEGDEKELAEVEQAERFDLDVWNDIVLAWCYNPEATQPGPPIDEEGHRELPEILSRPGSVTIDDVLTHGLHKTAEKWNPNDKSRIAAILVHDGWKRKLSGSLIDGRRPYFYVKAVEAPVGSQGALAFDAAMPPHVPFAQETTPPG